MKKRKNAPDLSWEERQEIYRLRKHGYGIREIARTITRAASTISVELRRHRKERGWCELPWYEKARRAHDSAKERRGRPRERGWGLKNEVIRQFVHEKLQEKLSPKSICYALSKKHPSKSISHEAIYQYIYQREKSLLKYLTFYGKTKRTSRGTKYCNRLRPAELNKRRIDTRPQQVNTREEFGHLESDFIVSARGAKSCLLVMVERKTRHVQLRKVSSREADSTRRTVFQLLSPLPSLARHSLTIDNDTAHTYLPELEKTLSGFRVYWCYPYRSWERGTVEAVNGIIRRFFPKKTNFDEVTNEQVAYVEQWFNRRPMEVLEGRTPKEMYQEELRLVA